MSAGYNAAADVQHILYSSVSGDGTRRQREQGVAAVEPGALRVWVECAASCTDGTLIMQLCCNTSDPLARSRRVHVDPSSGMCFTDEDDECLQSFLWALSQSQQLRMDDSSSGAGAQPTSPPSVLQTVVTIIKEARSKAALIWPPAGVTRAGITRDTFAAYQALAGHPFMTAAGVRYPRSGVSRGLTAMATLMSNALCSLRWPVLCTPVPIWALPYAAPFVGAPSGTAERPAVEFDAPRIATALQHLPPADTLAAAARNTSTMTALLDAVPVDSLCLLYWLLALAPIRLLHTGSHATAGRACDEYSVVAGPWTDAMLRTSPALCTTIEAALRTPPSWSSAFHPHDCLRYSQALYHGAASEHAYAILQYGLRSMSGTRHERNGAIFGAGVYLADDANVCAHTFASARGRTWDAAARTQVPMPYAPVFEVDVCVHEANAVVRNGARVKPTVNETGVAVPKGSYVVVPDAANVRITRVFMFAAATPGAASATVAASDTDMADALMQLATAAADRRNRVCMLSFAIALFAIVAAIIVARVQARGDRYQARVWS